MAGFNVDQHLKARHGRIHFWTIGNSATILAYIANMYLVLAYGASASMPAKISLATLIISVTIYAILSSNSNMKELMAIHDDTVKELSGTNYQKNYSDMPIGTFKQLSALIYSAVGLTQLWALFAG